MTIFQINTLLALLLLAHGASHDARLVAPKFARKSAAAADSVTVDQSGSGNFTTIQAAIDWVKPNNTKWVRIHVRPGTYKEKVAIPKEKQFIYLEGETEATTSIQWSDHGNPEDAATFIAHADNFLASHITFENTCDIGPKGPHPFNVAPAIVVWGDKSAFYNCRFISLQDTLGDWQGRHLFESCYIEGGMDFIWGGGQSQYKGCTIKSTAASMGPGRIIGYVTAQGRANATDKSAFVFISGSVDGEGQTFLGRAYRAYSTVIFSRTNLGNIVVPQGWDAWNQSVSTLNYVESDCTGAGSSQSGRVGWMKKLSPDELDNYVNPAKFIDQDGWIEAQPAHN